jgi:RNA polymerase sigma factor (sigma-70 family)
MTARDRFEQLVESLRPTLKAALARLCRPGRGIDPADVEQEALLRLWRAVESEREIHEPASYLWRAVSSAVCDAHRRSRVRREVPIETGQGEFPMQLTLEQSTVSSPEDLAQDRETLEATQRILAGFEPQKRRAVGLHLQGFTTEEIGELLGWSEPKARNTVYRTMAVVRQQLVTRGLSR